jgi:uncharacterized protein (TIGR03437 family)
MKRISLYSLVAGVTLSSGFAQIITTVAGTTAAGYGGDGGPANQAKLNRPGGLGVDGAGNVYLLDVGNFRIRKISTSGTITTVVGNGTADTVDAVLKEGAATQLPESPATFAVGQDGTIYFTDFAAKKVDPSGNLKVIGFDQGLFSATVMTIDRSGALYFALVNIIDKYIPNGNAEHVAGALIPGGALGDDGPALQGSFGFINGLASDAAGNIYVADHDNNRVRKFAPGGNITTVAGNGTAGFGGDGGQAKQAQLNGPVSVAVDSSGNVYISDNANGRIRRVDPSGVITTVVGQGRGLGSTADGIPAVQAQLNDVTSVAADDNGNLYFVDARSNSVRKVSFQTTVTVPLISPGGVTNAASFSTVLAPGELFSIFGTNLASTTASAGSVPLPMTLANTSVTVNGKPAPLVFVSATQINGQIPYEVTMLDPAYPFPGVVVTNNGVASLKSTGSTLIQSAPGIFQYGTNRAVVQNQDNSINATDKPAKVGSTIIVYLTGGGALDQNVATGTAAPSSPLSRTLQAITATIGGQPASVSFAGLTPGFVGLVQVNLVVPALTSGSYPVVLKANAFTSNAPLITVVP